MNKFIRKIFTEVPATYELVNHVLTFGLDILWRKRVVKMVLQAGGSHWLDVCTGTGETANYLADKAGYNTTVLAADFSLPMLAEALKKPNSPRICFTAADIRNLPFPDNSIDVITLSFATRNINTSRAALKSSFQEFHRILKPSGVYFNLETSQPKSKIIREIFHLFIKIFVKPVGTLISGSKAGYTYLSNTIPRFYSAEILADLLTSAGFNHVTSKKMLFGIAAIHRSVK